MRTIMLWLAGPILVMPTIALFDAANGPTESKLPGARTVIQATEYLSLQAALDALPPEGGVVRLPPGVFEVDQPLRLSAEDVLLEGSGTATHIKNVNTAGQPALVIEPPEGKKSIWRIKLSNFRVTGNPQSGDGIVARRVDELFIQGMTVSYHGGNGILLDNCYEDPRICDSLITYNKKTGLALVACHDIVVSSNQFEENLDAVTCSDGFNLCMSGNCLDDHLGDGVVIENTYGSVVSGNMIEECRGVAIVLDRDCYGITLSANVIAHNSGGGVHLRDAHGCAVSANTFTIVPKQAVFIGPASGRIAVTGNSFSNSYIGGGEKRREGDRDASGIVLSGTSDVTISGNQFSGLTAGAVLREGEASRRVLFANNVLTEAAPPEGEMGESQVVNNLVAADGKP